jgi:hypothetical protein
VIINQRMREYEKDATALRIGQPRPQNGNLTRAAQVNHRLAAMKSQKKMESVVVSLDVWMFRPGNAKPTKVHPIIPFTFQLLNTMHRQVLVPFRLRHRVRTIPIPFLMK